MEGAKIRKEGRSFRAPPCTSSERTGLVICHFALASVTVIDRQAQEIVALAIIGQSCRNPSPIGV